MTSTQPTTRLDSRFSEPAAGSTSWPDTVRVLERAKLYWLTTVRIDGRPHVTPLIGVLQDDAMHFCTGLQEQKARNLEHMVSSRGGLFLIFRMVAAILVWPAWRIRPITR
ncbi:MAG: pyridoxamine 5'-phosphate oxidase family protein [Pseudonocardiaceae bacterium]